eukprot:m.19278 g.19278  ORF g.19278 m.19278 type:complete len:61 (+) comp9913_c0_seq1:48-230(+)
MARGNQRDLARAKNAKKHDGKGRDDDGLSKAARQERDAKALQEKTAKKAEAKKAAAAAAK